MKFKASYNAVTNVLEIQFDLEAQVIIRKAALQISAMIGGRDPATITQKEGMARTDNLFEGLKLLQIIARKKSLRVRTTKEEAELTLGLVCFSNLHFNGTGEVSKLMSTVVTMLARVTPVVASALTLPLPKEVLDRRVGRGETHKSFKILRDWPGNLSVHDSFLLSRELKRITRPSRSLRKFIKELEMSSIIYWVMNKVLKPVESIRPKKKRKGWLG